MKRLLLILILTALPFSVSMAEDVRVFGGGTYDSEFGFTSNFGSIQHLGIGIYAIERLAIGEYGTMEVDIVKMFEFENSAFSVGILAGPNVDFIGSNGDGVGPTTYLVGAGGGLISYKPTGKLWGLHAGAKYKFSLDNNNLYQDGFQMGLFLSYRFGQ